MRVLIDSSHLAPQDEVVRHALRRVVETERAFFTRKREDFYPYAKWEHANEPFLAVSSPDKRHPNYNAKGKAEPKLTTDHTDFTDEMIDWAISTYLCDQCNPWFFISCTAGRCD